MFSVRKGISICGLISLFKVLNCSFTYQNDSKWNKFLGKVTVYRDVMWFRGMSCNVLEVHAVSIFIIEPYGGIRLL